MGNVKVVEILDTPQLSAKSIGPHHKRSPSPRKLSVTIPVHASKRLWAVPPLPVAAVERANATGHPELSIARQNALQFFRGGGTQISGSKLIHNKAHQLSHRHSNG